MIAWDSGVSGADVRGDGEGGVDGDGLNVDGTAEGEGELV